MWLTATCLGALSLIAAAADQLDMLGAVRPVLHDIVSPGRLAVLAVSRHAGPQDSNNSDRTDQKVNEQARSRDAMLRQLMIENARLRRDMKRDHLRFGVTEAEAVRESLVQLDVIPANVISSREGMPAVLKELLIDAGKTRGITRSELVVQGTGGVVDVGSDQSVRPGDRVLDGLTVIGRVEKVSRWVSLVQPVTALGFRSHVMLLRRTQDGLHFGARGILEGTGEKECRLTGISHTEPVATGDDIVSAGTEGLNGPQLYFGRVVSANFLAGGQWDIRVAPAVDPEGVQQVRILRWELDSAEAAKTSAKPLTTRQTQSARKQFVPQESFGAGP